MTINLQLSDTTYHHLLLSGSRIQGTIGLINPTEGNFNEHNKRSTHTDACYMKLPHGRASVDRDQVRLTLTVRLDETGIVPAEALKDESRQASDFVNRVFDPHNDTCL